MRSGEAWPGAVRRGVVRSGLAGSAGLGVAGQGEDMAWFGEAGCETAPATRHDAQRTGASNLREIPGGIAIDLKAPIIDGSNE